MHPKSTLREALEPTWTDLEPTRSTHQKQIKKNTFRGSLLESVLSPFWVLESIQGSPDLKKKYLIRWLVSGSLFCINPGTPKCARERSRYSLSSIFTGPVTLKKVETWSLKWVVLRSKILTILISRPLKVPLGTFFDASNFDLKKRRLPKSHSEVS